MINCFLPWKGYPAKYGLIFNAGTDILHPLYELSSLLNTYRFWLFHLNSNWILI